MSIDFSDARERGRESNNDLQKHEGTLRKRQGEREALSDG